MISEEHVPIDSVEVRKLIFIVQLAQKKIWFIIFGFPYQHSSLAKTVPSMSHVRLPTLFGISSWSSMAKQIELQETVARFMSFCIRTLLEFKTKPSSVL